MKTFLSLLFMAIFVAGSAFGQFNTYDYKNMTDKEIKQLRVERHAFYEAKSRGNQEAILTRLVDGNIRLDGNQADFDIRYYGLDLNLDFSSSTISGSVNYKIMSLVDGLESIDLNLRNELTVDYVLVDGVGASFSHNSHLLSITTPTSYDESQEFEMTVAYHGMPYYDGSAGMLFNTVLGYPMCWTKATPYRSRYWWPCKDYPRDKADSIDLYIERPAAYEVATNGVIISDEDVGGGRKKVHYKHQYPICTYNIALTCADYVVDFQTWDYDSHSMPVYSYTLANNGASKTAYETHARPVLTHLSDCFGLYPWVDEKCGNANFGWYGAMEHQTCNMYSWSFYTDWVIAHETAHQWWGDMITCRTFNHIWLNEGFASYSEALYTEVRYGFEAYLNYMLSQKYLGEGTIYVNELSYDSIYDGNTSYDKASWVLHMLRGIVGDTQFFQALHDWGDSPYKYGTATTADFIDILSTSVGEDMSWFINQWIYGDGHPDYDISWLCGPDTSASGYILKLLIEQTQELGTYFKMPIRMTILTTGPDIDTILWNEDASQYYSFNVSDEVTDIDLDPEQWILRTVNKVPLTLHMIPRKLPDGYLEVPYYQQLEAIGGVLPCSWEKVGGDLPIGVSFDSDSALFQGTPTWASTYYFTLKITDSDSPPSTEEFSYTLTVHEEWVGCGDADGNGVVEISDAIFLIDYIFFSGPAPDPIEIGDVDCNSLVEISDVVYLINYIFASGPEPCADC